MLSRTPGAPQTRWFGADSSFLSTHAPDLVFGLGTADRADEVRVEWMGGGETVREAVAAGFLQIAAPGSLTPNPGIPR